MVGFEIAASCSKDIKVRNNHKQESVIKISLTSIQAKRKWMVATRSTESQSWKCKYSIFVCFSCDVKLITVY